MIQSWYIACDTHLFLTAPVIVSLLYHRPKVGHTVLALALAASIITTFVVTYSGKLDAFLLVHIKILRNPIANKTFRNLYIPTHTRATPYYIGMITGLVRYKMKNSSYKINKVRTYYYVLNINIHTYIYILFINRAVSWFFGARVKINLEALRP
jgi:hypothetical protein